ncbi:ABC transporter substrate-binding protein [Acinetobacter chinensis]|uniref:ABC transporter substrate-binding protein n=1 Tax=Acinetobacter chinensis TaxID=2004650 RepID=A0A3B7LTI1_9GAMM|nr:MULTISPECIES: transglycosylase SLT domain-containing protein [Acinetobacter]AXY56150.1 ABC transporter substrate-binding protein [Acinetobacter chinensis]AXY59526.1 ABC transporter substrate-binding protein [Acinetobacter sp. WCHAc010052]MDV2468527.1 transglycosylase SLT domain-containing protein [Acinetobacter chinensis]WOE42523.1 transglycosylase SLT domain-containing protein [Acinetobacter chinensis]
MHSSSTTGSRLCLNTFSSSIALKALALSTVLFPFHSLNASKTAHQFDTVVNSNKLTVVAVESPTTVFREGQHLHGFGYDLVRNYADSLNVQLDFQTVETNAAALKLVSQGKASFAMTTASIQSIEQKHLSSFSATCGEFVTLEKNGLNTGLNWVFKNADDPLSQTANAFICRGKQNGSINQLASFYNRNVVKEEAWDTIQQDLKKRMPVYKASFKRTAKQYDLDWHLLAAIGYQESYLKPDSISPTGVRGLMMLTNNTAKAMGVTDRNDPSQSIQGGAKYYDLMLDRYENIPFPDRNWYALVAYNMGPGAVGQIQKRLKAQGKNPDQWVNMYAYLERNKVSNSRYRQALQYVTRIRAYLEHIKTTPQLVNI